MAYSKTTWNDRTTAVDASNLNKIEDALTDQDSRIDIADVLGGTITDIPNGSDLDDYKTPGKYNLPSNYAENAPTSNHFTIIVLALRSNSLMQIAIGSLSTAAIYVRYGSSTAWYSWYKIDTTLA